MNYFLSSGFQYLLSPVPFPLNMYCLNSPIFPIFIVACTVLNALNIKCILFFMSSICFVSCPPCSQYLLSPVLHVLKMKCVLSSMIWIRSVSCTPYQKFILPSDLPNSQKKNLLFSVLKNPPVLYLKVLLVPKESSCLEMKSCPPKNPPVLKYLPIPQRILLSLNILLSKESSCP